MPRLPRVSSRELIRALERLGLTVVGQRASHIVLQRGTATCVVPQCKEFRLGTLSGVLDQAGLTVDELLAATG